MAAPEQHEDPELNFIRGNGPPRHSGPPRSFSSSKPSSSPDKKTPSIYSDKPKTNPCAHCPCKGCPNLDPKAGPENCGARHPELGSKAGASKSEDNFRLDMSRVAALHPTQNLTRVNPRAFLASKRRAAGLHMIEDGCDGEDQDNYVCALFTDPENNPAFNAMVDFSDHRFSVEPSSLMDSLALLTGALARVGVGVGEE